MRMWFSYFYRVTMRAIKTNFEWTNTRVFLFLLFDEEYEIVLWIIKSLFLYEMNGWH